MVKIDWVKIPGGKFRMGLSARQIGSLKNKLPENRRLRDNFYESTDLVSETTERVINLDTFYISRLPITNEQYHQFTLSGHPYADPEKLWVTEMYRIYHLDLWRSHPCIVPWQQAEAFCNWIGGRLPRASEWEKAARGMYGRLYPWGNNWNPACGNFDRAQEKPSAIGTHTTPVETYPQGASPYGVLDMMGNVREWTRTFEWDEFHQWESLVVKGSCAEDGPSPLWFTHRATRHRGSTDELSYTGFRPVLDQWQHQYWAGFRTKISG